VPEATTTLGNIAAQVRSKNAGPFWQTLDVFFRSDQDYRYVSGSGVISAAAIASLYHRDPQQVLIFQLPGIRVIKISFPRAVAAGSFGDRDLHAGQQHVPLANLWLPAPEPARTDNQ
jgi:hypothetical protein